MDDKADIDQSVDRIDALLMRLRTAYSLYRGGRAAASDVHVVLDALIMTVAELRTGLEEED